MIFFSFKAKTKSNVELAIFYSAGKEGKIRIGAKNITTGYRNDECGSIIKVKGIDVIKLNNKYINEKLIGAKVEGCVELIGFNPIEYENAVNKCLEEFNNKVDNEIASLVNEDIVTLRKVVTGYGNAYSLKSEKISYEASQKFHTEIEAISRKIIFKSEDFDSSVYEATMNYGEFLTICENYRREREKRKEEYAQEEKEKFDQAKKTGEPVELYSVFVHGNEIPKRFRDEDSDMGHMVTYAMPDGSKYINFFHAH